MHTMHMNDGEVHPTVRLLPNFFFYLPTVSRHGSILTEGVNPGRRKSHTACAQMEQDVTVKFQLVWDVVGTDLQLHVAT
jgi:hypothetical protein